MLKSRVLSRACLLFGGALFAISAFGAQTQFVQAAPIVATGKRVVIKYPAYAYYFKGEKFRMCELTGAEVVFVSTDESYVRLSVADGSWWFGFCSKGDVVAMDRGRFFTELQRQEERQKLESAVRELLR